MVFQQFNLFPHLTVMDNLTLAARRIRHRPRDEAEQRARELLARVGLLREGRAAPASALRRPAAAGRDRPRADDGAARDALRRGHLRARSGARGRGADRDARPRPGRDDDARRHARDAVRARGRRPARLHGRGPDRRGGSPRRACWTSLARSGRGGSCAARSSSQDRSKSCQSPTRKEQVHEEDSPGYSGGGRVRGVRRDAWLGPANRDDGTRSRGGDTGVAEAAGRHRQPKAIHRRRQVRHAAVRLPGRSRQERGRRRRDRQVVRPLRLRPRATPLVRVRADGRARAAADGRPRRPRHLDVHVHGRPGHADRLLPCVLQGDRTVAREERLADPVAERHLAAGRSRRHRARSTTAGCRRCFPTAEVLGRRERHRRDDRVQPGPGGRGHVRRHRRSRFRRRPTRTRS